MFESESIRLLPAELQWRTVVPKQGESVRGWVGGKLQVQTVHFVNKASRPCRDKITRGGMHCYCGKTPMSSRQIGYLPLITKEREKVVILMCATTSKKAALLETGQPVEFWRPARDKVGLMFKVILPEELGETATENMRRMKPHDIRQYLLQVLWQDTELIRYFEKHVPTSDYLPVAPPPAPTKMPPLVKRPKARDTSAPVAAIVQGLSAAFDPT